SGDDMISMSDNVASRHAVFMARATVDLVLIAALLQAISISSRNRQQKRLYNSLTAPDNPFQEGLLKRLDLFVERRELRRAISATRTRKVLGRQSNISPSEAADFFDLGQLGKNPQRDLIDFRRYDSSRLHELHATSDRQDERAFIAAIAHERPDFTLLSYGELLDRMAEQNRSEFELYTVLQALRKNWEKPALRGDVSADLLRSTLFHVRNVSGLKDFKSEVISLFSAIPDPLDQRVDTLADVAGLSNPDGFQYARVAAARQIGKLAIDSRDCRIIRLSRKVLQEVRASRPGLSTERAIEEVLILLSVADDDNCRDD
ncbi:MAG: hypothetical protein RLN72_09955, partial [Henriciella sp.]